MKDEPLNEFWLYDCGCFKDCTGKLSWLCAEHRGETEERRQADAEQHAWEGAAMNGWVEK